MRRLTLAFIALLLVAPPSAHAATVQWVRPVDGAVVKAFAPPTTRYGSGHLGVHFRAAPGTPVRAAGAGVVTFAGKVAYSQHIVIRHDNGWRTTYSFVATMSVREGERVARGEIIATTGGRGPEHDGTVLHFGLRIGETYADPMQLFVPLDLTARVHLAPLNSAQFAPRR